MFKTASLSRNELTKIQELRQHTSMSHSDFAGSSIEISNIILPHATYSIRLDSLKNGFVKADLIGKRVIEASDTGFKGIYDLFDSKKGTTAQLLYDTKFMGDYQEGFAKILENGMQDQNFELRTLRVPSLNLDVIWLHSSTDEQSDRFIAVRSLLPRIEEKKFYTREEFFSRLKEEASNIKTGDLLGG